MTASPSFELYTQRNDKNPNSIAKTERSTSDTNFLWISVKDQRIDLDTFSESNLVVRSVSEGLFTVMT